MLCSEKEEYGNNFYVCLCKECELYLILNVKVILYYKVYSRLVVLF